MNQHRLKQLKRIFALTPTFSISDPRRKGAWREFQRRYLAQPRSSRSAYISSLESQVAQLNAVETAVIS